MDKTAKGWSAGSRRHLKLRKKGKGVPAGVQADLASSCTILAKPIMAHVYESNFSSALDTLGQMYPLQALSDIVVFYAIFLWAPLVDSVSEAKSKLRIPLQKAGLLHFCDHEPRFLKSFGTGNRVCPSCALPPAGLDGPGRLVAGAG